MLLGRYDRDIDQKGRVMLPVGLRQGLGSAVVLARSPDGCVAVYPKDDFVAVAERIVEARGTGRGPRQDSRAFFAGAREKYVDSHGRVAVDKHLREYGGLQGDVVVVGVYTHLELWAPERWQAVDGARTSEVALSDTDDSAEN
jgi:MraZ protein